jgi:hypothetical protein
VYRTENIGVGRGLDVLLPREVFEDLGIMGQLPRVKGVIHDTILIVSS